MLESLKILNFQCHQNLSIELSPKVTSITGISDVGKSAIIRALRWVCLNKPNGNAFLKNGESKVKVILTVDGIKVSRSRANKNTYSVGTRITRGESLYHSFGQGVPGPIETLLNVDELNFQQQHEAPFWFSKSSGEVSRELNKIVNLDLMDTMMADLASHVRSSQSHIKLTQSRLDNAIEEKESLSWTTQANEKLKRLETVQNDITLKRSRIDSIASLVQKIGSLTERLQSTTEANVEGGKLLRRQEEIRDKRSEANTLSELIDRGKETCQKLQKVQTELTAATERLQKVKVCPLCERPMK